MLSELNQLQAADALGHFGCGANPGACPELSQSDLLTLQQVMVSKTNKSCSNMDADDVAIRGTILFADCGTQSCLDQIPPRSLYEAVSRLVEAVKDREESVDMREGQWKKSALSDADKQGLIDIVTCGLLKALDARARYRAQTPSSTPATRRKRSTASQQVTCEDILILDTKSNVLTVQQINDLNTTDFDNCAETLGTATGWSLEQKAALIGKAKQTWGQQSSNWTKELIQRMGSIAQGLSESEITSLANLDLDVLSTLGQYTGWTLDQLKSGFSSWLKKYINNNISAITGSHLQQIGDFACGATAQQISSISTSAFKDALNKIGTLYSCSAEQLEAWAALGLQALGSVTEWTYAQSATFDVLYAGLSGSSLSLLSSTQLSMISLDVFVRIKPTAFSALTVSQMASLSTAQALSVTDDQLSVLNPAQKAQLRALGATISDPSGAPGVSVTASTLAATWTAVWLIMAY
ncbi:stereocilin-like isoform X2 [Pomacea canaliculata]|uniref:stereocilin-like isoform X2 n=1 Tax=Pomacea canaliculata TaxID=400727 RepID=UPI000D72880A|nr:stereocilin-like isoform X2 [Pomacea canaliculata]